MDIKKTAALLTTTLYATGADFKFNESDFKSNVENNIKSANNETTVTVIAKVAEWPGENLGECWVEEMDAAIGKTFKVTETKTDGTNTVYVLNDDDMSQYYFPAAAVRVNPVISDYTKIVNAIFKETYRTGIATEFDRTDFEAIMRESIETAMAA